VLKSPNSTEDADIPQFAHTTTRLSQINLRDMLLKKSR
jgi:hypothetical protein